MKVQHVEDEMEFVNIGEPVEEQRKPIPQNSEEDAFHIFSQKLQRMKENNRETGEGNRENL